MTRQITSILLFLGLGFVKTIAQKEEVPKHQTGLPIVTNLPAAIAVHVPAGYEVLDTAFGNLNLDGIEDLIIVLRSPKEDTSFDSANTARPLLILFGEKRGGYKLAFQNNKVVFCITCGGLFGDPFEGITIKNGYFTVEHYGGNGERWSDGITFKFNKVDNRFYFHREDISSYYLNSPNKATTTVKRVKDLGIIDFEKYDSDKQ